MAATCSLVRLTPPTSLVAYVHSPSSCCSSKTADPPSPNASLSSRLTREGPLCLDEPPFAWPVCCSALVRPVLLRASVAGPDVLELQPPELGVDAPVWGVRDAHHERPEVRPLLGQPVPRQAHVRPVDPVDDVRRVG